MLSEKIKKIAHQTTEAAVPVSIMFGEVKSVSPLTIFVDNRFLIPSEMLIIPRHTVLEVDDRTILIRNAGGQQFLVMGVM